MVLGFWGNIYLTDFIIIVKEGVFAKVDFVRVRSECSKLCVLNRGRFVANNNLEFYEPNALFMPFNIPYH